MVSFRRGDEPGTDGRNGCGQRERGAQDLSVSLWCASLSRLSPPTKVLEDKLVQLCRVQDREERGRPQFHPHLVKNLFSFFFLSVTRFLDPKKRRFLSKSARKSASLKCQLFYCIFARFRVGLISDFVKKIFSEKIITILLHKFFAKPKSATFSNFAHCARSKFYRASSPQKAPLSRKITRSGHTDVDWFFFIFCKFCLHFDDGAIFHSRNFAQQKQTQKSAKEKVSQSQLPNLLLAWPWISKGPQFRDRVQRSSSRGRVLGEVNVHDLNPKSFVAKSLWIPGMRRGQ